MKSTKLFGAILPANPEFIQILKVLREKYDIPEFGSDVEVLPGLFGLDFEPELVMQEILDYFHVLILLY